MRIFICLFSMPIFPLQLSPTILLLKLRHTCHLSCYLFEPAENCLYITRAKVIIDLFTHNLIHIIPNNILLAFFLILMFLTISIHREFVLAWPTYQPVVAGNIIAAGSPQALEHAAQTIVKVMPWNPFENFCIFTLTNPRIVCMQQCTEAAVSFIFIIQPFLFNKSYQFMLDDFFLVHVVFAMIPRGSRYNYRFFFFQIL